MPLSDTHVASPVLELIFEESDVGRCLVAPDDCVLRANREWLRSTGFRLDDVLGHSVIDLFPETRDMALALYARARAGHAVDVPVHAQHLGGRETWWDGRIDPVPMAGGTGLLITAREVSRELRAARDGERAARGALEDTLDRLPDGFVFLDREWRFTYANRRAASNVGAEARELLGRNIWDLFPSLRGTEVEKAYRRVMAERVPLVVEEKGTLSARWYRQSVSPMAEGISVVWTDITERKKGEQELAERESELRAIFNAVDESIWLFTVDGVAVAANRKALERWGGPPESVLGKRLLDFLPDELARLRLSKLQETAATGRLVQFEDTRAGMRFEHSFYPVAGAGGRVDRIAVFSRDVTERRQVEDERRRATARLEESDRAKSEFMAVLSHELRNPLAPIRNSLFILERAPERSEQTARARAVLRRQTDHLVRLVDDLLDVTRISRGKVVLQRAMIDLRNVVRTTTDDLLSMFEERGVALRLEQAVGPVWVQGDAVRLAQVLTNLLQNAAKFTPSGGTVRVSLSASEDEATLTVRDSGEGMEPDEIERMFEPFAQAAQGTARTRGGLGLGLALVKGFVDMHGGTVRAASAGRGKGSEFVVTLPVARIAASAGPAQEGRPSVAPRDVLVIEDNADAGRTLADLLQLQGHRVRVAFDGRSGLALLKEQPADVVLCDVGLPDIDGYEVARAIRGDPALAGTRLVALTGYAQPEDRERARQAGFDVHLPKPPPLDELERLLRELPARAG